jgi:hypothetical protein
MDVREIRACFYRYQLSLIHSGILKELIKFCEEMVSIHFSVVVVVASFEYSV